MPDRTCVMMESSPVSDNSRLFTYSLFVRQINEFIRQEVSEIGDNSIFSARCVHVGTKRNLSESRYSKNDDGL